MIKWASDQGYHVDSASEAIDIMKKLSVIKDSTHTRLGVVNELRKDAKRDPLQINPNEIPKQRSLVNRLIHMIREL